MAAYQLAVEQRADMIEIDLHVSRDGAIPVSHDAELERIGGQGEIADCDFAELQSLDAGDGHKVPALAEILDRFGPQIPFNLELKQSTRGPYPGLPAAALCAVRQRNERQSLRMTTTDGKDIAIVQIAGLLARRILIWVDKEQKLRAGERFGMIRFGSRVDVYLDDGMVPLAVPGQSALAGETVLARSLAPGENASPRTGETR